MWFKQRTERQGLVNYSQLRMPASRCTYTQGFESFDHLPLDCASLVRKVSVTVTMRNNPTANLEISLSTHKKVLKRLSQ